MNGVATFVLIGGNWVEYTLCCEGDEQPKCKLPDLKLLAAGEDLQTKADTGITNESFIKSLAMPKTWRSTKRKPYIAWVKMYAPNTTLSNMLLGDTLTTTAVQCIAVSGALCEKSLISKVCLKHDYQFIDLDEFPSDELLMSKWHKVQAIPGIDDYIAVEVPNELKDVEVLSHSGVTYHANSSKVTGRKGGDFIVAKCNYDNGAFAPRGVRVIPNTVFGMYYDTTQFVSMENVKTPEAVISPEHQSAAEALASL